MSNCAVEGSASSYTSSIASAIFFCIAVHSTWGEGRPQSLFNVFLLNYFTRIRWHPQIYNHRPPYRFGGKFDFDWEKGIRMLAKNSDRGIHRVRSPAERPRNSGRASRTGPRRTRGAVDRRGTLS